MGSNVSRSILRLSQIIMKGITTYLLKIKAYLHKSKKQVSSLESIAVKGEGGGVPWFQVMKMSLIIWLIEGVMVVI